MHRVRLLLLAALLLTAGLVAGQDGTEYVPKDQTVCWDCHAPGLWNPDMDPNFEVFPLLVEPAPGDEFTLTAELQNLWRAQQLDMFVTLDIGQAPSLRFVGGADPVDATAAGSIAFEPSTPTNPLAPQNNFLTEPARANVRVDVPTGATALRLALIPDDPSPTNGADLTMRVFDARTPLDGTPRAVINDAGQGATEVFRAPGAADVASGGFGNWTVQAETTLATAGTQDPQNIGFTVRMDAWFNVTEEVQQVKTNAGPLAKGLNQVFEWRLTILQEPGADEQIRVFGNATTYYDHEPPTEEDWSNMTVMQTAPVRATGNGTVQVGLEPAAIVTDSFVPTGVSMAAISEAIGYGATLLLLMSIITGGIFGKTTRRWQNQLFGSARRRVAFHNFLSYGIIAAAIAHTTIFVMDNIEPNYPWQLGLLWGGLAILCMFGLGVTGAAQVPMIRHWNYSVWRWTHFSLTIGAIVFTLVHMMLDGQNFGFIQEALNYTDPIVPAERAR